MIRGCSNCAFGTSSRLLFRGALLLLVLPTLAEAACLNGSVPVHARKNVTIDGVSMPLGIWYLDWPSATQYADIFKIVAEEILGYNVADLGYDATVESGIWAIAGSARGGAGSKPAAGCDLNDAAVVSYSHLNFETYDYYLQPAFDGLNAINKARIPVNLGSTGYVGIESNNVLGSVIDTAIADDGLPLDFYRLYNASWYEPWKYFDTIDDINASVQSMAPKGWEKCVEYAPMKDAGQMQQYIDFFGDTDGTEVVDGQLRGKCVDGIWWVSPACRHNRSLCVPYLTTSGWGMIGVMHKATAFNMPIVMASIKDFDEWIKVTRASRAMFYWWLPDSSFVDLFPRAMKGPDFNSDEQAAGLFTSDFGNVKLEKWAHPQLELAANKVFKTATSMQMSLGMMMELLLKQRVNGASSYEMACQFVRDHEDMVRAWVPDSRQCIVGQGLNAEETECEFCQPASYSVPHPTLDMSRLCVPCAAGTFQELMGQSACKECESGKFAPERQTSCMFCEKGMYSDKGQGNCTACLAGMTTQNIASTSITDCVCDRGFYSEDSTCMACPAGSSTANIRSTSVLSCKCTAGTYMSASGDECIACPPGSTTASSGAAAVWACACQEGEYMPADFSACLPCRTGMTCAAGSAVRNWDLHMQGGQSDGTWPKLQARHMSLAEEPLSVYDCRSAEACPGGDPGDCPPASSGIACGECQDEYIRVEKGGCEACTSIESSKVLVVCPLLMGPGIVMLLYRSSRDSVEKWGSAKNGFMNTLFLVFNYVQSVGMLRSFTIEWPLSLDGSLANFEAALKLQDLLRPQCAGVSTFQERFFFQMLAPVVIALIFFLTWALSRAAQRTGVVASCMNYNIVMSCFGNVMYTFSVAVSSLAFSLFRCYGHPNGKSSLQSAPEVLCDSQTWSDLMAVGVLGLVIYVVAVNVVVAYALVVAPKYFNQTSFRQRWKFLFLKFRPEVWWWGQVLIVRGVLFNLVLAMAGTGVDQIWLTHLLYILYGLLLAIYKPWSHRALNHLDIVCCLMFISTVSLSSVFAPSQISGDESSWRLMMVVIVPICVCTVFAAFSIHHVLYENKRKAATLKSLYELRGLFRAFVALPACEVQRWALRLTELDWEALHAVRNLLITESFGQLPSWFGMRLIWNTPGPLEFYKTVSGIEGASISVEEASSASIAKHLPEWLEVSRGSLPGEHLWGDRGRHISKEEFHGKLASKGIEGGTSEKLFQLAKLQGPDYITADDVVAVAEAFTYAECNLKEDAPAPRTPGNNPHELPQDPPAVQIPGGRRQIEV